MEKDDVSQLSQLGSKTTEYRDRNPSHDILESFPNPNLSRNYEIRLHFPEFTSLCPKTGQPDFATVDVLYIPDRLCVETKSLKLYFFAYRNEGSFMERIANRILDDLVQSIAPRWMKVVARFASRGGVRLEVFAEHHSADWGRGQNKLVTSVPIPTNPTF